MPDPVSGFQPTDEEASLDAPLDAEPALIARASQGDVRALEEIVHGYAPAVYRIVCGHLGTGEADDATQEVFLNVQQGIASFECRSSLGTWIHRIATNVSLNRLRRRRRKPTPASLDEESVDSRAPGPHALAVEQEARRAFDLALATLSEDQRAVVVLRAIEGLSFEEIARILGIPMPTAESRMARARERLRAVLGKFLDHEATRASRTVTP